MMLNEKQKQSRNTKRRREGRAKLDGGMKTL